MKKEVFLDLWHSRNPQHEINADSGEDMFYDTAFMVALEFANYVAEQKCIEQIEICMNRCVNSSKDRNNVSSAPLATNTKTKEG